MGSLAPAKPAIMVPFLAGPVRHGGLLSDHGGANPFSASPAARITTGPTRLRAVKRSTSVARQMRTVRSRRRIDRTRAVFLAPPGCGVGPASDKARHYVNSSVWSDRSAASDHRPKL